MHKRSCKEPHIPRMGNGGKWTHFSFDKRKVSRLSWCCVALPCLMCLDYAYMYVCMHANGQTDTHACMHMCIHIHLVTHTYYGQMHMYMHMYT